MSFEIARSSENVVAMAIGLEDYTADLGVPRTIEGKESFYARTRLVVAARPQVFSLSILYFRMLAIWRLFRQNVLSSKALGF